MIKISSIGGLYKTQYGLMAAMKGSQRVRQTCQTPSKHCITELVLSVSHDRRAVNLQCMSVQARHFGD